MRLRREPEVHVVRGEVSVVQGRDTLAAVPLADVVAELARVLPRKPSCAFLPRDVRLWWEWNDVTGVIVELPPHVRTVRWLAADSPADFGPGARYERYRLAFPYVVLLLVFRRGALSGWQQLFYRRAPLGADEDLLLPNLLNVADAYRQRCWLCLVNLGDLARKSWPEKIAAVVTHTFTAGFNRSAEVNEGHSYWSRSKSVDPRVAGAEAWQEASAANPYFAVDVAWHSSGLTASAELERMMEEVSAAARLSTAVDLAGLVTRAGRAKR
jgi:hypothetical protein